MPSCSFEQLSPGFFLLCDLLQHGLCLRHKVLSADREGRAFRCGIIHREDLPFSLSSLGENCPLFFSLWQVPDFVGVNTLVGVMGLPVSWVLILSEHCFRCRLFY